MNNTEQVRGAVLQALRNQKKTKEWLAEKVGQHKSWATRFFNGEVKSLTDEQAYAIQDALEISLFSIRRPGQHTTAALDVAAEFDSCEGFAKVVNALRDAMKGVIFTPRYIATDDMGELGKKIIAICKANPEKPGKVARLVLELLA